MHAQRSVSSAYFFMSFREIENLMPLKNPNHNTKMLWNLMRSQDLPYFKHHLKTRLEVEESEIPEKELIEIAIAELYMGLEYIPKHAIPLQKYYMRQPRGL
jgi:hypothetical protein